MLRTLLALSLLTLPRIIAAQATPGPSTDPPAAAEPILRAIPVEPPSAAPADASTPPAISTVPPADATPVPSVGRDSDPAPALPGPPTGDDAVRLQIFLDQSKFGPGVIDGKPGQFTKLAVQSWNEVNGHPPDDWEAVLAAARESVPNPFAVAIVPETAKEWIDPSLPTKRSEQAKRKRMSYRSVGEFMSERYHTSVDYLITLNGSKAVWNLAPHSTVIVPNVEPFLIESLTGARYEADDALSARHVVVNTKINQVRIFEATPTALVVTDPDNPPPARPNRALVASFPITPGQPKFIHYGTWEMKNCLEFPYWRYDQQLLDSGKRSKNALNIPSGPNSPVGILWAGLSRPGIGLHGTADPETIGRARSAGCIRLANWDAIRLPTIVRPGATVEIR